MERIVQNGIVGGIVGGPFGLLITVPREPVLGVDGPLLQMALPITTGFSLFGAWFASVPCLADEEKIQTERPSRVQTTRDRLAA
ncbi:MAG: hypothetical protein L0387_12975 [Acidobacteria bacterium]|nr:hypothetical protein [Acidobacteriota bacterium]